MSRPRPPAAYPFRDDREFVVRGVETAEEALAVALDEYDTEIGEWIAEYDEPLSDLFDEDIEAADTRADDDLDRRVAERVRELAPTYLMARPAQWYRFNPCHPSSCWDPFDAPHAWHLGEANGPGRGNWRGVRLEWTPPDVTS